MDGRLEEQPEILGTHTNCVFALPSDVFKFRSPSPVPLRIFMLSGADWKELPFPLTQKIVRIGSSRREADILIDGHDLASVQLILRRIGCRWYIFDSGDTQLALFNGFKRRQAILDAGMKIFVELNGVVFLFCVENPVPASGSSEQKLKNSFTLSFNGSSLEFSVARPALIGQDSICDMKAGDNSFSALVFYDQPGGFYLYSPFGHTGNLVNSPSENALKLSDGSKFRAGTEKIIFNSDFGIHHLPGASLIKDMTRVPMVLIELDDMDNIVNKLVLPDKGHSVFVGRGPGNYFMIDGRKISKKHAQIMMGASNICVVDNSSTNGTYVNGERIERKLVRTGDSIRFGDRLFILTCAE